MLRVKLIDKRRDRGFCRYTEGTMIRVILGTFQEPRVPPFRDPESLLFIQEVDKGHLVEGDWYSYVSRYGRTCMSSLCGGTQYALTLIHNSRRNVYTTYEPYGEDIWQRLQSLDMDILVAYDPNHWGGGVVRLPWTMKGCIAENVSVGGVVYKEAVYDAKLGQNCTDEAGVFHFDGCLDDHKWIWGDHLKEIFECFAWDAKKAHHFSQSEPGVLKVPPEYCGSRFRRNRNVLCCSDAFVMEGNDKYPRVLYFRKYPDGTMTVGEGCPCKWPNFYEALEDVADRWDGNCEATFYMFIDTGRFFCIEDFRQERLWYFEDDGTNLRAYSGARGLHRLMEFVGDSWKDGTMRAL